jgi:hypothetical protein
MDYFTFVEKCKEFILWRNFIFMLTINKLWWWIFWNFSFLSYND